MFDQPLKYTLVQINKNRYKAKESFNREFLFKFYRHNYKCCIKYVVSVKEYDNKYLTLDFYPKIDLTPKHVSIDSLQDLRYRLLTKQNSFGFIGATILRIIQDIQNRTNIQNWGFLAASLPQETSNYNNKRFGVYVAILRRTITRNHFVFGSRNKSAIFVVPIKSLNNKELIVKRYEQIFSEAN